MVVNNLSKLDDNVVYVTDKNSLENAIEKSKIKPFDICYSTDQYCMSNALKVNASKHVVNILDVPIWLLECTENVLLRNDWDGIFKIIPEFDVVVVHSKLTPGHILKQSPIPLPVGLKIEHIPYSIDIQSADDIPPQKEIYQICMVSVFSPHKHQELLIEAVGILTKGIDICGNQVKLDGEAIPKIVLVGAGLTEDRREDLQGRADHYNIPLDIHVNINQFNKFELIKQSMFGVYTQKSEYISGLFPIECFYCGKKCICFDYEINQSQFEQHAIYVSPDNPEQLAVEIFNLIDKTDKRIDGTEKAMEFVKSTRTPAKHAENLYNLFKSILGEK